MASAWAYFWNVLSATLFILFLVFAMFAFGVAVSWALREVWLFFKRVQIRRFRSRRARTP